MIAALRIDSPVSYRLLLVSFLLSSLVLAACGDATDSGPTAVWDDDGVREQGTLSLSPSSFHVREGDSVAIKATYQGPANFQESQLQWSVEPSGAGVVREGWFVPSSTGQTTLTARFSAVSASATGTVTVAPTRMEAPTFDGDVAFAGRPVPGDVTVLVTGRDGLPVVGEEVRFEVVSGGGEVARAVQQTNDQGRARVSWTMGPKVGTNALRAVVEDLEPLELSAESTADRSSATVEIRQGDEQSGHVDNVLPQPLAVQVVDRFGNPVDGVMVEWLFDGGQGATSPTGFTHTYSSITWKQTPTDSLGRSQLYWKLGRRAGSQYATVDVASQTSSSSEGAAGGPAPAPKEGQGRFKADAESGGPVSIEITPSESLMEEGQSLDFVAAVLDEFGNELGGTKATWSVSDGSLAKVTGNGKVTALGSGSFDVIATYLNLADTARVDAGNFRVVASTSSVTLSALYEEIQLSAVSLDADGNELADQSIEWSTTDPSVASVDNLGRVLSRANGIATIIVSLSCCTTADSVQVTVDQEPTEVAVQPAQLELAVGETRQLDGTALDGNGYDIDDTTLTWSSSDPDVATVSSDGQVTAIGPGTISIMAAVGAVIGEVQTAVTQEAQDPASIEASVESHTFTALEESLQLGATVKDADGSTLSTVLSWSSTNTSVVTVDGSGRAVAKGNGTAKVIVAPQCCNDVRDTVDITMDQAPAAVLVDPSSFSLSPGGAMQLAATVRDANGFDMSDAQVSWSSTNTSVITVGADDGIAKAVSDGTATIKAQAESATGTSSATVSGDGFDREEDPLDGGTVEPIFFDDFESGDTYTTAGGFSWNGNGHQIMTQNGKSGSHSLQFTYGPDAPGEDSWSELRFTMPAQQEVWFEYYLYIPDGTESYGGAAYMHRDETPNNNKFWYIWNNTYRDYHVKAGLEGRPVGSPRITKARPVWGTNGPNGGNAVSNWGSLGGEELIDEADRGSWIHLRFHIKASDTGKSNGIWRGWKNGRLVIDGTGIANDPLDGVSNRYDSGYLMGWANSGFTDKTIILIDDFRLYDLNPGW